MTDKEMWAKYKEFAPEAQKYEAWAFGGTSPQTADILADLVIKGIKTATASNYKCYIHDFEKIAEPGDLSIILNSKDEAVCIIKTTKVTVTPFNKVTPEHAYKEGEDDRSLAAWRECHKQVFSQELEEIGEKFDETIPVVCEEFEVVYPK